MGTSIQMAFLTLSLLPSDITISNSCFQDSQMSPLTGLTLTHAPFSLLSLSLKDWGCTRILTYNALTRKQGLFARSLSFSFVITHTRLLFTHLLWNVIMGHLYSWRLPPPSPNKCCRRSNLSSPRTYIPVFWCPQCPISQGNCLIAIFSPNPQSSEQWGIRGLQFSDRQMLSVPALGSNSDNM